MQIHEPDETCSIPYVTLDQDEIDDMGGFDHEGCLSVYYENG